MASLKKFFMLVSTLMALSSLATHCGAMLRSPDWIVGIHNAYRRLVGLREGFSVGNMKKMRWDSTLAREAKALASCENVGRSRPEPIYDRMGIPTRGTNVAYGRANDSLLRLIHGWYEERRHFDLAYNMCHFEKNCENYMQLVSADTDRVGCALNQDCMINGQPSSVFVCSYAPGLNAADPVFQEGVRCSLCSGPTAFCEFGLCSDCKPQWHDRCECRKDCRSKNGYGVLSKHTCTCHCIYGHGPNCNAECRNPEVYMDYDMCAEVSKDDCRSDDVSERAILQEFCPEQCSCRALPKKIF